MARGSTCGASSRTPRLAPSEDCRHDAALPRFDASQARRPTTAADDRRLQEEGLAVLSDTTVHGTHGLRAAISHHRTQTEAIGLVIEAIARIGAGVGTALLATA